MGRHGHRYWYHATGLPGWMRPACCAGWIGFGHCYSPPIPMSRDEERAVLGEQARMTEEELGTITKRIEDLKK
jgi:hypothetical protein